MKQVITLLLILSPVLLVAQKQKTYDPIDKVGWILPDLSSFDVFDSSPAEPGSVTYLLVVDKIGQIKKVKPLANTFDEKFELTLRNKVKELILSKADNWKSNPGNKGTLEISMLGACSGVQD